MRRATVLSFAALFFPPFALAANWPQFRGPDAQGHATVEHVPLRWEDENDFRWKTAIEGLGWSSPVIQGDRIWLTTAVDDGRSLRAVCLDLATGREIFNTEVFNRDEAGRIHAKNSHASPTPLLEGDKIYVHFGAYGTACLSSKGEVLWRTVLKYKHVHGPGGSPVIFEDLLILSCDGGDAQFVVALDKKSGVERWRTARPENSYAKKFAFCTPLLIDVEGRTQLISPGAGSVVSYEPTTGKEIWRVLYPNGYSVVPRPVFGNGLLYVCTGFDRPALLAIRPDGRGDVTDTHVAWQLAKGVPHNPSPLLLDGELYMVSDGGVATCLDATTGEQHWRERLGGNFSASPLLAAGRIYFLDEKGTTTVIKPGTTFQKLAKNTIEGRTLASLTPVVGGMLLRTDTHLYRIDGE